MRLIDADAFAEFVHEYVLPQSPDGFVTKLSVLTALNHKSITPTIDMKNNANINGWISVKDRLPEISYKCAVVVRGYGGHAFVQAADYLTSRCDWYMWERNTMAKEIDYEITHWMPFPEPPKEE